MNILLLSYIINLCCVRLRYHKMRARTHARTHTHTHTRTRTHTHTHIIEWKIVSRGT